MRTLLTFLMMVALTACGDDVKSKGGPPISTNNNTSANCGNGVLDPGEACDSAIASGDGACPTACAAPACASASLQGSVEACTATCVVQPVACANGDGCCPEGCDSTTDTDCTNTCGNGLVESPETCDGNCPASCDDGNACTTDVTNGNANTCSLTCTTTAISACINGDGCCPTGCTEDNDSDCDTGSVCGNGEVEAGELCDGNCPSSCDDGNACTINQRFGSADTCDVTCSTQRIQSCQSGDGCCPAGCTFEADSDCNCTPSTCQQLGVECGAVDNGCGMPIDCGGCPSGEVCGGGTCQMDTGGTGAIGDARTESTDCADTTGFGSVCQMEVVGNFCTAPCIPGLLPCPQGAVCDLSSAQAGLCYAPCNTIADCRPGFTCADLGSGQRACIPPV